LHTSPRLRTAKFRLGNDQLLTGPDGKSWISFEDFAVALADEIERPDHIRSDSRLATDRAGGA
jgi:putative NADH-flavin reductase